jgi:hypothetical protein
VDCADLEIHPDSDMLATCGNVTAGKETLGSQLVSPYPLLTADWPVKQRTCSK